MLVHHLLEQATNQDPCGNAVYHEGKWITYEQLNQFADSLMAHFVESNVRHGDRIALICDNSIDYVIGYFGILKAGAVVVNLNTAETTGSIVELLGNSGARFLILQQKYIGLLRHGSHFWGNVEEVIVCSGSAPDSVSTTDASYPFKLITLAKVFRKEFLLINPPRSIDLDVAEIVYTSGSTGKPKGVMLTHLNLVSNMRSICRYLELSPKDRIMVVLPFFYIYGKSLLLTHCMVGGSIVIDNRFAYPQVILQTMKETEVTGFAGVPSTFSILSARADLDNFNCPSLRYVTQAGGSMASPLQQQIAKQFAPAKLYIMYGATEASPRLSYLDPALLEEKAGSVGKPVDNVELRVVDCNGIDVQPGEEGEIIARGSNIMKGYWNDPEVTQQVLRNGCFYTGDMGTVDEDGFLYIVGRKKDIIKVKGHQVNPKEVEDVIMRHEAVEETMVVGVADSLFGEAVKAFVVKKCGCSLETEELKRFIMEILPPYKVPTYIEHCTAISKNSYGKTISKK